MTQAGLDARPAEAALDRLRQARAWVWALPPVVYVAVRYQPGRVETGLKTLLAIGFVALLSRRPDRTLLALVALLPFQVMLLATLYRYGVPEVIVRGLGFWKEGAVAALGVAAVRTAIRRHDRFDVLDWVALLYLGLVGLYWAFPTLFVHPTGPLAVGPPTDSATLNVALRANTMFVVVLLAVRHLAFSPRFRDRVVRTVLVAAAIVALAGFYEFCFSSSWNSFVVHTLQVPRYKALVLRVASRDYLDVRVYSVVAGREVLRIGSVFLDQLGCGLYLVLGFAVGVERVARGHARAAVKVATALTGVAILLTQTRAAILAGVVVIAVAMRARNHAAGARVRFGLALAAAAVLLAPLVAGSGLVDRTRGAGGDDQSTQQHIESTRYGLQVLGEHPLGQGLGTGASTGARFGVQNTVTSEDYYLQVGNETGIVTMAVFVALALMLNRRLRNAARRRDAPALTAAIRAAFLGLSVAALLLHVWLDLTVAWTAWALVAVALPYTTARSMGG